MSPRFAVTTMTAILMRHHLSRTQAHPAVNQVMTLAMSQLLGSPKLTVANRAPTMVIFHLFENTIFMMSHRVTTKMITTPM